MGVSFVAVIESVGFVLELSLPGLEAIICSNHSLECGYVEIGYVLPRNLWVSESEKVGRFIYCSVV